MNILKIKTIKMLQNYIHKQFNYLKSQFIIQIEQIVYSNWKI